MVWVSALVGREVVDVASRTAAGRALRSRQAHEQADAMRSIAGFVRPCRVRVRVKGALGRRSRMVGNGGMCRRRRGEGWCHP